MDNSKTRRLKARRNRTFRVRKKLSGTDVRPRLTVAKTGKHVYAQLIDDVSGVTLAAASTLSKENKSTEYNGKSKEAARHIGKQIADMAKKKNINAVIFDRGRFKFHGVVAELANSARESGLSF